MVLPKSQASNGWGPNPEKIGMGGAPKGGDPNNAPKGGGPKFRAVFSWNFGGVFEAPGAQMCTFGVLV